MNVHWRPQALALRSHDDPVARTPGHRFVSHLNNLGLAAVVVTLAMDAIFRARLTARLTLRSHEQIAAISEIRIRAVVVMDRGSA